MSSQSQTMLNAASMAIAKRAADGTGAIDDVLDSFFADLGMDTAEWFLFVRSKSMLMGEDFARKTEAERLEVALGAAIAVGLSEGFMLGVEFVRAQRGVQAAMQ